MKIQMAQYQNWIVKDHQGLKVTHMLSWPAWSKGNIFWVENITPNGIYPAWLDCVWKRLMFTFFSSWMSLFKVKIASIPLRGMEKKTRMGYAKCPDLLGKKVIVYFLWIPQCPQKGKYSNQWILCCAQFPVSREGKMFPFHFPTAQ